ncbi:hypothetical protein MY11210_001871 [Beauveria gryllotalpidicola]
MPTPSSSVLLALPLAAIAIPLAPEDYSASNSVVERLGGGLPPAQSMVRGFFIGTAAGIPLALLCCCWWPCRHPRRTWRIMRGFRRNRERQEEGEAIEMVPPRETQAEQTTATATATTTGRAMAT